ncbi:AAA family ATPase [Janthinobacterium lividum]|uniref:AAA family ATPase n=1 Tax=Janthinobacterium lividum TaxID=29581 RepID=UPI001B82213E|nr:ATP-binding protein [Janthinobacterium lividum]MBR7634507.1 AAA family ATPase [Janthinobacterium lividum]
MLKSLALTNVGPAGSIKLNLGDRLNLITGDNGLGKSFLLDVTWWALTRRWPHEVNRNLTSGYMAKPTNKEKAATIAFSLQSKTKTVTYSSQYSARDEAWLGKSGRPWNPGLVIYAHADGGFSVWDPARNYWIKRGNVDVQDRIPAYVFTAQEVWDGLDIRINNKDSRVCNGLISDWAGWIKEKGVDARRMASLLKNLAPSTAPGDQLKVSPTLGRLSINDSRDIPMLRTAYGVDVPIVSASSGVKRIVALAYMLMWSWNEHRIAVEELGESRTNQVTLLVDEIEAHLHPKWQRSILKSILEMAKVMHAQASVQLIAATHSPMILASAEPLFNSTTDAWFDLDLVTHKNDSMSVELTQRDFVRRGDISHWLTSNAFDFKEARSLEAENAITEATKLIRTKSKSKGEIQRVNKLLKESLGEIDRFWLRWEQYIEGTGN